MFWLIQNVNAFKAICTALAVTRFLHLFAPPPLANFVLELVPTLKQRRLGNTVVEPDVAKELAFGHGMPVLMFAALAFVQSVPFLLGRLAVTRRSLFLLRLFQVWLLWSIVLQLYTIWGPNVQRIAPYLRVIDLPHLQRISPWVASALSVVLFPYVQLSTDGRLPLKPFTFAANHQYLSITGGEYIPDTAHCVFAMLLVAALANISTTDEWIRAMRRETAAVRKQQQQQQQQHKKKTK
ncbi:hypothetical protein RI367_005420 [Sorochytrium milnesiophthora]